MKTLSEWLSYKDNGVCTGEFDGQSGAWSYRLELDGGCPKEAELLLFISELKNRRGWMHSEMPLGRENFTGFVRRWRKEARPEQWVAFARVDSVGSLKRPGRQGYRPLRPDIGTVQVWWKPAPEPAGKPILAEC